MISEERYQELLEKYCDFDNIPDSIKTIKIKDTYYKDGICPIYELSNKKVLDLLDNKEFMDSLTPTEIGFLIESLDSDYFEFSRYTRTAFEAINRMALDFLFVPGMQTKYQIAQICNYHIGILEITDNVKYVFDYGYYLEDNLSRIHDLFDYIVLDLKCNLKEYYGIEIDSSKITYDKYAIQIESYYLGDKEGIRKKSYFQSLIDNVEDEDMKKFIDRIY